jgi:signal transduction histidine kinase
MRLLLAEDDPMIGRAMGLGLRDAGLAVDWVTDGRAAELALANGVYDLAVLDLGLPGKGGMELLRELRARRDLLPVLIVTARCGRRPRRWPERALHPIELGAHPRELHLLVSAINDLMARLGNALALQRNFLADAAHELRTPIAALRLQLQLLERTGSGAQRGAAQDELRAGVARVQHLVEQLLELSRLGPETPPLKRETVDLADLARAVVSRFSARADEQSIRPEEPVGLERAQALT